MPLAILSDTSSFSDRFVLPKLLRNRLDLLNQHQSDAERFGWFSDSSAIRIAWLPRVTCQLSESYHKTLNSKAKSGSQDDAGQAVRSLVRRGPGLKGLPVGPQLSMTASALQSCSSFQYRMAAQRLRLEFLLLQPSFAWERNPSRYGQVLGDSH